jgi:hypothetical protein
MAQSGYTPILIYASGTASNTPSSGNLTSGSTGAELAINYADGKLFYKDSGGSVQVIATKVAAGLTAIPVTTAQGGTGVTTAPTAGSVVWGATTSTLGYTAAGTSGQPLLSGGSGTPTWGTLSVGAGGTGSTTLTANNVLLGNGTSALQVVAPGTSGNVLTSNGTTWVSSTPAGGGVTSAVAGTGISVSSSTGAVTFTNTGVTSITNGGGLSISGSTGAITITNSNTGTVTSVATGNGLSGGTITTSGTLTLGAPGSNTIGSYIYGTRYLNYNSSMSTSYGSDYAAGSGTQQIRVTYYGNNLGITGLISGTWRWMGANNSLSTSCCPSGIVAILVRVA